MMNKYAISSIVLSGLLSGGVQAMELRSGIGASLTHNSNVYGTSSDEVSDLVWLVSPEVELRNNEGEQLDFMFSYAGEYQAYQDEDDANAMEHRQRMRLRYDFDRRTRLTFNQRYRDVTNLQFDRNDFEFDETGIDVNQNSYERLDLAAELSHELTRRWTVVGELEYQDVDFKRNFDRSDSSSIGNQLALKRLQRWQAISMLSQASASHQ